MKFHATSNCTAIIGTNLNESATVYIPNNETNGIYVDGVEAAVQCNAKYTHEHMPWTQTKIIKCHKGKWVDTANCLPSKFLLFEIAYIPKKLIHAKF